MQILPEVLIFAEIAFYFSLKNLHICRIAKIQSYEKRWSLFVLKRACARKFFPSIFEDAKKDFLQFLIVKKIARQYLESIYDYLINSEAL